MGSRLVSRAWAFLKARAILLIAIGVVLSIFADAALFLGLPSDTSGVAIKGATGPGVCQQVGVSKWHCTTGTDWQTCAADSSVSCTPTGIVRAVDASLENVALLADFQATGVTCDGGFPCIGVIRRYMPGLNAGGAFVTPQWSQLDTPISSDLSGPLSASTAAIQYASGKVAGTMYCPVAAAVSCVFDIDYGLSYVASSYDAGVDSGDAADAADAADSSDSGPPPTITAMNVDFISAAGGLASSLILTGTNFTGATITISGTTAPPSTVSNTGTVWTLTPASSSVSTTQGNPSVSTITVTNNGQNATASVWVVPAGYAMASTLQNATTSAGPVVATIPDMSGNGATLTVKSVAPAYTAQGTFGQTSYMTLTGLSTIDEMVNTSFPAANTYVADGEWIGAARSTLSAPFGVVVSTGGSVSNSMYVEQNTASTLAICNLTCVNSTAITVNSDFHYDTQFTNSTSDFVTINGGAPTTGSNAGSVGNSTGWTLGGYSSASGDNWVGRIYQAFFYPPSTINSTGRSNISAYFTAKGLSVAGGMQGGTASFGLGIVVFGLALRRRRARNDNSASFPKAA